VPRNHGGSDDLSNLQALCFRCNAGKRDTDSTDFRGLQASYALREAGCVFCGLEGSGRVLLENELALCIADAYPVTPGHSLVIPRRHVADGLALHHPEWNAGGCGPLIPKPDQSLWNGSMEGSTPPRACLASFRSWLACILSQKPSLRPKKRHRRRSVSALIVRRPFTIALMRLSGTPIASASRY